MTEWALHNGAPVNNGVPIENLGQEFDDEREQEYNRSRQVEARLSGRPTGRPHTTGEAMNAFAVQSIRDTVNLTHALGQ